MRYSCWILFLLHTLCVTAFGFYDKSDVIEVSADSFEEVVLKTNYTSIVEFYAPWCGYCQKFKGGYRKAGKLLRDLVQVVAVNCDLETNKPLCGKYKVQGFPSVKVFRPPKAGSKNRKGQGFANEDYNGERNSKGLVSFAQTRVKSYVKRIFNPSNLEKFLSASPQVKMVLVSDSKRKPSLFLKSLAIDYLGVVDFGYFDFKNDFKETDYLQSVGLQDLKKPFFVVYSGDKVVAIDGELSKEKISEKLKEHNIKPNEGPGSDRKKVIDLLKKGKTLKQAKKLLKKAKSTQHDEL